MAISYLLLDSPWSLENDEDVSRWVNALDGYTLKTADVMQLAGVTGMTVVNWALSRGLLYKKNPSGEFRFKPSEVEKFLALRPLNNSITTN